MGTRRYCRSSPDTCGLLWSAAARSSGRPALHSTPHVSCDHPEYLRVPTLALLGEFHVHVGGPCLPLIRELNNAFELLASWPPSP